MSIVMRSSPVWRGCQYVSPPSTTARAIGVGERAAKSARCRSAMPDSAVWPRPGMQITSGSFEWACWPGGNETA